MYRNFRISFQNATNREKEKAKQQKAKFYFLENKTREKKILDSQGAEGNKMADAGLFFHIENTIQDGAANTRQSKTKIAQAN